MRSGLIFHAVGTGAIIFALVFAAKMGNAAPGISPVDARSIGLSTTATPAHNTRILENIADNMTVLIPSGSYKINQTTFTGKSRIRIMGAGPSSKLLINNSKYGMVITRSSGITIENLYLGGTSRVALYIYDASSIKVLNNYITGATKTASGPMAGIEVSGASDIWIDGNYLTGNGDGLEGESYEIVAWTGALNNQIHIRNNTIIGTGTHKGIGLFMATNCDVIGNYVNQGNVGNLINSGYGIISYQTGKPNSHITISNNVIENTSGSGIYCANNQHVTIAGNQITNTGKGQNDATLPVGAISLINSKYASISNNTISNSYATAISLSTASSVNVQGNTISNSATRTNLNFFTTIHLRATASNIEIKENILKQNRGTCINYTIPSTSMSGITIDNNILDDTTVAIRLGKFNDAIISNNKISNYKNFGIHTDSGINAIITGNIFSDSTAPALDIHSDNNVVTKNIKK